ncbi:Uncharacterised protein [Pseudomonas aeruginosa]|nr:Uncharacterised protein [Pseudomonas aeruginosa]
MNDRELLELAARAAGYQFSYPYHSISIPLILAEDWAVATMGPTTRRRRRAEAGSSA